MKNLFVLMALAGLILGGVGCSGDTTTKSTTVKMAPATGGGATATTMIEKEKKN